MTKNTLHIIISIFVAVVIIMLPAKSLAGYSESEKNAIVSALYKNLTGARTPADSLKIYYDIFDLSTHKDRNALAAKAFNLAVRAHDVKAQYDLLRNLASDNTISDSLFNRYRTIMSKLPDSPEKRESLTFLDINRAMILSAGAGDPVVAAKIQKDLRSLFDEYSKKASSGFDAYSRFENVFKTCSYLSVLAPGEFLGKKLAELERLLTQLPGEHPNLTSLFYTFASATYSFADNRSQVVRMCELYDRMLDEKEQQYHAAGRKYRSYDNFRYVSLRRALSNYDIMPVEKVDSIYACVQELAANNEDIREDIKHGHRAEIFWHMAHHRYKDALNLLKRSFPLEKRVKTRNLLLEHYVIAARGADDKDALRYALSEYNKLLEKRLENKRLESDFQSQMFFNNSSLFAANSKLRRQSDMMTMEETEHRILYGIIAAVALLIVLMIFYSAYRRARMLGRQFAETNHKLQVERDMVREAHRSVIIARDKANIADRQKTDFVHDIIHEISEPTNAIVGFSQLIADSTAGERRVVLERFVEEIRDNAEKLQKYINNVLSTGFSGNRPDKSARRPEYFDFGQLLTDIISVHNRDKTLPESLHAVNLQPSTDTTIYSDKKIVTEIVSSIITLAADYYSSERPKVFFGADRNGMMTLKTIFRIFDHKSQTTGGEVRSIIRSRIDELNFMTFDINGIISIMDDGENVTIVLSLPIESGESKD